MILILIDQLTIYGQKALLTISKILQRLANQEYFDEQMEPHMIFANRFIRKALPQWNRSFHKFMVTFSFYIITPVLLP